MPTIRQLNIEAEGEDNAIFAAYRFAPAFAFDLPHGDTILIHFCTNKESLNDVDVRDIIRILQEQLPIRAQVKRTEAPSLTFDEE